MKKIYASIVMLMFVFLTNAQSQFWTVTDYKGAFPVTDNTPQTDWTYGWSNFDPENTNYPTTQTTISSDITTNTTLSGVVLLQNKIYVKNGATLTIQPGTIIRGDYSTQGTLIVTRGCKLIAEGTQQLPIVFTSNNSVGNRSEGDWGGVVILGNGVNNQPGGVANIEGIVPTPDTEFGGNNDMDNSGSLKYVRIEFGGIPLSPNKEINGITFGSVGSGTQVDYVQVSYSGDDSFEWFGGTVNCKHLISYSTTDDDFDTDFGYRGNVQFGLSIRNENLSDAAGDSNCFESDNDAQGSVALPQTAPIFSNFTLVGAKGDGSVILPTGEKFEKAFRIRRNSAVSVFNTLVVGWEKGLSLEGTSVEDNVLGDTLSFNSNVLCEIPTNCLVTTPGFLNTYFTNNNNDSLTTINQINWVNIFVPNGLTPDCRLDSTSFVATGADFTNSKFGDLTNSITETIKTSFKVFPNPTEGLISIDSEKKSLNFVIYNSLGNVVKQNNTDLSDLENGIYIINADGHTEKVIVKK
jgi:hypothetical protein